MKIWADFNGLFSQVLCLSHSDSSVDEHGNEVPLRAGMFVTAYMEDADEHGQSDNIMASGIVEPSPDWLSCRGSKWCLRIDENGVYHESDLKRALS